MLHAASFISGSALDPKQQEGTSDTDEVGTGDSSTVDDPKTSATVALEQTSVSLEEGHHVFAGGRKGISYDRVFGPYTAGASRIVITDPYI